MTVIEAVDTDVAGSLDTLDAAVFMLQRIDLDGLEPEATLQLVRRLEVERRRLDHATDRIAGHLDDSGAFSSDGHRNARSALKHLGRLSGAEAHGRIQSARALRRLPAVDAAYARGSIPTQHVRAIARVVSNPRVTQYVGVADPVFAEQAATESFDDFSSWLRQWESLADADGAAQDAERTHERRTFSLQENPFDGSFASIGHHGGLQGAAMKEILDRFEDAEFAADWADARRQHGDHATVDSWHARPGSDEPTRSSRSSAGRLPRDPATAHRNRW